MAKEKEAAAKPAKKEEETFKYGVEDLANKLGIEAASARIKLRKAGIKKASTGRYGWNTKEELGELVDKLKAAPAEKKAPAKKETKKAEDKKAPAKADKKAAKADA